MRLHAETVAGQFGTDLRQEGGIGMRRSERPGESKNVSLPPLLPPGIPSFQAFLPRDRGQRFDFTRTRGLLGGFSMQATQLVGKIARRHVGIGRRILLGLVFTCRSGANTASTVTVRGSRRSWEGPGRLAWVTS